MAVRLLEPRAVLGVVLMAGSMLAGVLLLGSAEPDRFVWAAARDIPAGGSAAAADLIAVPAPAQGADHYLEAQEPPPGRALADVARGELVLARLFEERPGPDARTVTVPVDLDRLNPGIGPGSRVDVWATTTGGGAAALVARAAVVAEVAGDGSWAGSTAAVMLEVEPGLVADLVGAGRDGTVDLVLDESR